jgi:hypothetical protein
MFSNYEGGGGKLTGWREVFRMHLIRGRGEKIPVSGDYLRVRWAWYVGEGRQQRDGRDDDGLQRLRGTEQRTGAGSLTVILVLRAFVKGRKGDAD